MQLTETALQQINNKRTKTLLALALDFTERWITGLIEKNRPNGHLTTITALRVIQQETGLKLTEILTDSSAFRDALSELLVELEEGASPARAGSGQL